MLIEESPKFLNPTHGDLEPLRISTLTKEQVPKTEIDFTFQQELNFNSSSQSKQKLNNPTLGSKRSMCLQKLSLNRVQFI